MNDAEAVTAADGSVGLVEAHTFVYQKPFTFEDGQSLPEIRLRYETYGQLNKTKSNAIMVCHALSGDHHCAGVHDVRDRKPGWWDLMVGPGKPIDTRRFFVICSNCLGGCNGSTGPVSINPETQKRYNLTFPAVSIADMVRAQSYLCDFLGIDQLHCVIGGSMGGMQVLQWAIDFPERVRNIIPLATTGRQNAQIIGFNAVGRSAIVHDPKWQKGNYSSGDGPDVGLAVARMMAHITYLSNEGMQHKFGRSRRNDAKGHDFLDVEFEVESYLRYQGRTFVGRFDANSYLYLTKALDHFDLYGEDNDLEQSLSCVKARVLIVGFTSDWLYPPSENRAIVHALLRCGKEASYAEVSMNQGHDSFLIHSSELFKLVTAFLS